LFKIGAQGVALCCEGIFLCVEACHAQLLLPLAIFDLLVLPIPNKHSERCRVRAAGPVGSETKDEATLT
jgi:hypothetical protein